MPPLDVSSFALSYPSATRSGIVAIEYVKPQGMHHNPAFSQGTSSFLPVRVSC
jgi:hypothetical protein